MAGLLARGQTGPIQPKRTPTGPEMASSAFGTPGSIFGTSGSSRTAAVPEDRYGYDEYGNRVQVGEGQTLQQWKPDTLYAGQNYFEAPPPQDLVQARAGDTAQYQPQTSTRQTTTGTAGAPGGMSAAERFTGLNQLFGNQTQPMSLPSLPMPHVPQAMSAATNAATDMARTRAREKIGSSKLAAVKSFQNQMDARGHTGSTFESGGVADIIASGASDLANFETGAALDDVTRARQVEDRNYAGAHQNAEREFRARENQLDRAARMEADRRNQALKAFTDFYTYGY
jgi:hypothetical protein